MELEKKNKIIDEALKEHYRETMERKRVPTNYLLMFTEGGESNAVADAIEKAIKERIKQDLTELMYRLITDKRLAELTVEIVINGVKGGVLNGK